MLFLSYPAEPWLYLKYIYIFSLELCLILNTAPDFVLFTVLVLIVTLSAMPS